MENIFKFILEDALCQIDAYSVEKRMLFVRHLNEVQRIISTQCKYSVEIRILCVGLDVIEDSFSLLRSAV